VLDVCKNKNTNNALPISQTHINESSNPKLNQINTQVFNNAQDLDDEDIEAGFPDFMQNIEPPPEEEEGEDLLNQIANDFADLVEDAESSEDEDEDMIDLIQSHPLLPEDSSSDSSSESELEL
jgi:hypothetical protein